MARALRIVFAVFVLFAALPDEASGACIARFGPVATRTACASTALRRRSSAARGFSAWIRARLLIVEDAAPGEDLRRQLAQGWPEARVVRLALDREEALHALHEAHPDVVFLDMDMVELRPLELARLASRRAHVVFMTTYDEKALTAFEEGAVDCMIKPVTAARLAVAIDRVKRRLKGGPPRMEGPQDVPPEPSARTSPYLHWINAWRGGALELVTTDDVLYFRSDSRCTRVAMALGDAYIRKPIRELVRELDPALFWQVHRSTIVNLNAVARVDRDTQGHVILALRARDDLLRVSQPYAHLFRQM